MKKRHPVFLVSPTNDPFSRRQVVMKLGTGGRLMEPEYMWETSLDPSTVVDTFVACGVLYGVERDRRRRALKVAFAVDLYDGRIADQLDIPVVNVYRRMTRMNYNPRLPVSHTMAGHWWQLVNENVVRVPNLIFFSFFN